MNITLLHRLGARDRALYELLLLPRGSPAKLRTFAIALTHLGGARVTIAAAIWPLLLTGRWQSLGRHAFATLFMSHVIVQLVKSSVGRPRPSVTDAGRCLIADPDRFSFPSGHAAASLSVALAYAMMWPALAVPILVLAWLVGGSRIALGVHYPGDVAAGQSLAVIVHLLLVHSGI